MEPLISFRNVNHSYGDGHLRRQVLYDVSAEIRAGEIVLLTGPSGSGKTTLLTLAGSLRSVQDGSVRILGQELKGASRTRLIEIRRRIGFIFQAHNLLDALSAAQNVQMSLNMENEFTGPVKRERCVKALEAVGIGALADHLPQHLSGGEKQRVAIARALVHSPNVVLADEPTAALDRKTGREVVELLHGLAKKQGCAIMMVTHDNRILDIADRILSLEDGRISSFASALTASTSHAFSLLAQTQGKGDLMQFIGGMSSRQFLQVLEDMTSEWEQLLRVIELGKDRALQALFEQILQAATLKTGQLLNADRATLFLVNREQEMLTSRFAEGGEDGPAVGIRIPIDTGIVGRVALTGQPLNVPDPYSHPDFNSSVDKSTGYHTRSILCFPIRNRRKEVFAVAQLLNRLDGQPFSAEDERNFAEFLEPLGLILEGCVKLYG